MKFETNGPRLNVAHTSQQECGEDLAISQAMPNFGADLLEEFFARGFFEEPDQGLDLRLELADFWIQPGFGSGNARQVGEEGKVAQSEGTASEGYRFQEAPAGGVRAHKEQRKYCVR